jgi:putative DNA primase/helicase
MGKPMRSLALAHAKRGRAVFPLASNSKKPFRGSRGLLDATRDRSTIKRWWREHPEANIGIATGSASRQLVIDSDPRNGGNESRAAFEAEYGPLPPTREVHTPSGGRHFYFALPEGAHVPSRNGLLPGIDIRGDGGYVVAPGSRNGKGRWTWVDVQVPIVEAPESLLRALSKAPAAKPPSSGGDGLFPESERHPAIYSHVRAVHAAGVHRRELLLASARAFRDEACAQGGREIDNAEVERIVDHVLARAEVVPLPTTDSGNAERFVRQHGENVQYVHDLSAWQIWNGRCWGRDDRGAIMELARATVRGIYDEASHAKNEDERKRLAAHAVRSESRRAIEAMLALAQSNPRVATTAAALDLDPWTLNVQNGLLDLRTDTLGPHSRDAGATYCLPFNYDPDSTCPQFERFLRRVLDDDANLYDYVQRALGYALTGSTREQCFFILYGSGANGKSTLLEVIRRSLGPLAQSARVETFLVKRGDGIPNDFARIRGRRLVTAVEADGNGRLSESTIKQLTGGDTMTARFMRAEFFDFVPACKIILSTNHRPVIRGTDHAIWRRVKLIPFTVTIPEAERDPDLLDKLTTELPGILAWLVRGCAAWQEQGLGDPEAVRAAVSDYRADMDVLGAFIADQCVEDPGATTLTGALYARYCAWCATTNEREVSARAFTRALLDRGFEAARDYDQDQKKTVRVVRGLRLRPRGKVASSVGSKRPNPEHPAEGKGSGSRAAVGSVGSDKEITLKPQSTLLTDSKGKLRPKRPKGPKETS